MAMKWGSSNLLAGKVALVTGGAQGIGGAVVDALTDWGACVMVADLDQTKLDRRTAMHSGQVGGVCLDLTIPGAADLIVEAAWGQFGTLDIVVNNAGYAWDSTIVKMSDEQYSAMHKIHSEVPFRVMRAAAKRMIPLAKQESAEGKEVMRKFVNVTSGAYSFGLPGAANYAAGKAAMVGLTKSAAKEWGRYKFNVNAVAFGPIYTRMGSVQTEDNVIEVDGNKVAQGVPVEHLQRLGMDIPDPKEVEESITLSTPMKICPLGRTGTMEEAASAILFLCSPLSDYVHGQVLTVSGGVSGGMA